MTARKFPVAQGASTEHAGSHCSIAAAVVLAFAAPAPEETLTRAKPWVPRCLPTGHSVSGLLLAAGHRPGVKTPLMGSSLQCRRRAASGPLAPTLARPVVLASYVPVRLSPQLVCPSTVRLKPAIS